MSNKQKVVTEKIMLDQSFPRWASNVTGWDEEKVKLRVRSLEPKFTNMTFAKRKGPLIQLDFSFVELDMEASDKVPPGESFEQQITLQDKSVLPHSTVLIPEDVAVSLFNQLRGALVPEDGQAASGNPG